MTIFCVTWWSPTFSFMSDCQRAVIVGASYGLEITSVAIGYPVRSTDRTEVSSTNWWTFYDKKKSNPIRTIWTFIHGSIVNASYLNPQHIFPDVKLWSFLPCCKLPPSWCTRCCRSPHQSHKQGVNWPCRPLDNLRFQKVWNSFQINKSLWSGCMNFPIPIITEHHGHWEAHADTLSNTCLICHIFQRESWSAVCLDFDKPPLASGRCYYRSPRHFHTQVRRRQGSRTGRGRDH